MFRGRERSGTPVVFSDDENGYRNWLVEHPGGFVLNCDRTPKAAYLVVHRASCGTINGTPTRGSTFTTAYLKVGADSIHDLDAWVRQRTGGTATRCGTCQP
jgi:hypothetical protein